MSLMSNNEKIEFQLYDWLEDHIINNDDNDDDDDNNIGNYIIHSFGRCADGKSVYAQITGFTPYFYILIPEKLQSKSKSFLEDFIKKIEFNLKNKDNKKIYYKYKKSLKEIQLIKLKRAEGFTNDKEYYFARLVFDNVDGLKKYRYYLENNEMTIDINKYKFKLYESNLLPMLRCFHIRDISGCSWVETKKYNLISNEDDKESRCDIEINVDWRNLTPIKKDFNAPLKICSFDIECYSIDGEFPQAKRKSDCIIQIGTTYTLLGESTPYRQYIACLNKTSKVENIIIDSYESEQEVIFAFLNEINNNDCDIITGYNTFYFDENYINDRCKNILNINISYMSKLKKYECKLNIIKLASDALGENILKFWNTPGRVHIDLMKDVQKTYNLDSYRLDYVASYFIRGYIKSYNKLDNNIYELYCDTIQDICKGDYIHIEVTKGFVSDNIGKKYLVIDINNIDKIIMILGSDELLSELDLSNNFKINWSQAKDDLDPKDIFRLYKGSNNDRGIVAKYCIKDCKLVNLLINKLETVTKNIEMSNVCYIPLSFLFTRGQGIKIFSLCSKEYRLQKYVFPVYKVNKLYNCKQCNTEYYNLWQCSKCESKERTEIISHQSSYEGAIVFDPIAKVEYQALATKDYMSLYPSSIMHKNMSHETIVENPIYDNLPNIKYYNAQFKDSDGSIQYRRFAQINDKLGVIPTILNNLLKERKNIKQKMKKEIDPFKYKILDAKQFAVKITANSLYGQLGATTSPIFKRDIAACTTSTGREMLILAKKYDEEQLPFIINSLKYFYKNNEIENINMIYDIELKNRTDYNFIKSVENLINSIQDITLQPIIRYGDSIIGKTPLLLRNSITNEIFIKSIEDLVSKDKYDNNNYKSYFMKACENSLFQHRNNYDLLSENHNLNKESVELNYIETWTEKGWTKIQRIIRHKLHSNKQLYRVTTHSGSVIVTDDHSLLLNNGNEIKPNDINSNHILLHSFPYNTQDIANEISSNNIYTTSNDIDAMVYYYNERKLGKNIDVNFINNQYILSTVNDIDYSLRSIEKYNFYEEYVYDLTTDNQHFHAGVGSLIVHNTDSIFSCYRFRKNTSLMNFNDSLYLWKKIIKFGYTLLEPFFSEPNRKIFNNIFETYYSNDKIINMKLPIVPEQINNDINSLEYRITNFIKEYMEESYIPWLWTLSELVEKDYTNMFDIKLIQWVNHLFSKMDLCCENLIENRKKYLCKPILDEIDNIFSDEYCMPSDERITEFTEKFNNFPFKNEITLSNDKLYKLNKNLLEKTIKEKWEYSYDIKELTKIINNYLTIIIDDNNIINNDSIFNYIKEFLKNKKKLEINILSDKLIDKLENDYKIDINKLNLHTKIFIEKYNKNIGKKKMEQIIEEYIEKDLLLHFNNDKNKYYDKIINFIKTNMRRIDMSDMDNEIYIYYWIQQRWIFNNENSILNKECIIDIYEGGEELIDKKNLEYTIELGKISGELIKSKLPFPHDCEYEKTYWPFGALTKKKYFGIKYEFDINISKLDFMGIVLKRRDNAPIVKEICSGIINYMINKKDPLGAKDYVIKCLDDMFNDKYNIKYFLQSRTIKSKESYKDWKRIAHIFLADKISKRDPGNTPQSGDRIEYAVIKINSIDCDKKLLQGDIIETPQYIMNNNLEIDYLFYLTNQIMNPALQFLELVDKNASSVFNNFIVKYSQPKIIKEKIIKEKIIKEKIIKEKIIKDKTNKNKTIKDKIIKDKIINDDAINILININKKKNNKSNNYNYRLQIKKLLDEINDFNEDNKFDDYFISN